MNTFKNFRMNKRERIICTFTIFALTTAHTFGWVKKKRQEIIGYGVKIVSLESSNRDTENLINAINQNRKPATELTVATEKAVVSRYISNSTSLTGLLHQIATQDGDQNFHVRMIRALPPPAPPPTGKVAASDVAPEMPFDTIPFSIQLETEFLALGRFMEKLENAQLMLDIYSIEMKRVPSDLRQCTANIKLNSFIPKDKGT